MASTHQRIVLLHDHVASFRRAFSVLVSGDYVSGPLVQFRAVRGPERAADSAGGGLASTMSRAGLKHYIAAFPTVIARNAADAIPAPEYHLEEGETEPRLRRRWNITFQTAWYLSTMSFSRLENRPPYFIERRITQFRRWLGRRPRSEQFQKI